MRITIESTNKNKPSEKLVFETEEDGGSIDWMMLVLYRALVAWGFSEDTIRKAFRLEEDEDLWNAL